MGETSIQATKIKAKDLKAGDLFSTAGPSYWNNAWANGESIGEKVYMRTEKPCPLDQRDVVIYRIQVVAEAIG